jgi:hypothetical protein
MNQFRQSSPNRTLVVDYCFDLVAKGKSGLQTGSINWLNCGTDTTGTFHTPLDSSKTR